MRKVLAFLLIAGLLFTASPAFADSPSEAARQGSVTPECSPVPLITLSGIFSKVLHHDCYEYYVADATKGTVRVEFGPKWYITTAKVGNYDGDGTLETIAEELNGLVGNSVTLVTKKCSDGSYEVFTINGEFYRKESGPPPWSGGPKGKGKGK